MAGTIKGTGQEFDLTMKASDYLKTTTTQFRVVGAQGNTAAADWTAYLANNGQTLNDTGTAHQAIGINQTYMSASATECNIRLFGVSKAVCESTITAGDFVVAYDGISTTTYAGAIMSLSRINETNVTCGAYGMSTASFQVVLGRALQNGITNSVISIFLNPQLYDRNFWAYT